MNHFQLVYEALQNLSEKKKFPDSGN